MPATLNDRSRIDAIIGPIVRFAPHVLGIFGLTAIVLVGQNNMPAPEYRIYAGNTHSHTAYTWSHGDQFAKSDCAGILTYSKSPSSSFAYTWSDGYVKTQNGCAAIFVMNGSQYPSPGMALRPDWTKYQGSPSDHFAAAKAAGYDFYAATDHSQEAAFQPPAMTNELWSATRKQATEATDDKFVALAGFEYSENDGPGGTGHMSVINSEGMLNALAPGIDLPYFYNWLKTAKPNGDGPIVVSFNHPDPDQYNNWDYRDPAITDIVTLLEVINSNNKIHYPAFIKALDRGWKVSPVAGNDNHGLTGITRQTSRTFVLAKSKTKAAILDAMKNRQTYASLDRNIQCRYSVNGAIMGSTLTRPDTLRFDIVISDPDSDNPKDKITKLDIVTDSGVTAMTYTGDAGYSIHWTPEIKDTTSKYFFVRIWNAGGGDAPGADPTKPVAWLAPVWTGR
jgi:hypothetical protein